MENILIEIEKLNDGREAMTPYGHVWYDQTYKGSVIYFIDNCGDHYVTSYKRGAILILSVKSYIPYEYQIQYNNLTNFEGDVIKLLTTLFNLRNTIHLNYIDLITYQIGGKYARFLKTEARCNPQEIMCHCMEVAKNIVKYAREEFPKQISFEKGDPRYGNSLPLDIQYTPSWSVKYKEYIDRTS